jgi:hypothetical protein
VWTTLPSAGYAAAVITQVTPGVLPVGGGTLVITGDNFGPGPCGAAARPSGVLLGVTQVPDVGVPLSFQPASRTWAPSSALVRADAECHAVQWSPTTITCTVPPGVDASVTLSVMVAGQAMQWPGVVGFEAPVVTGVTSLQPVGTPGGTAVTVLGAGFPLPPWPLAVLVGDAPCVVVNASSRVSTVSLTCVAPRGVGTQTVTVFSPLQSSNVTGRLTYAAPTISDVTTLSGRPIEGGFAVTVQGAVRGVFSSSFVSQWRCSGRMCDTVVCFCRVSCRISSRAPRRRPLAARPATTWL